MSPKDEKEGHVEDNQRQATEVSASNSKASKIFSKLHCPKCNSSRIRKRSTLPSLLVTISVFIILLLLLKIFAVSNQYELYLSLGLALPFSFCAIFAAAWSMLFGEHKCKSCGYRFRSMKETEPRKEKVRFPTRFCVLNGAIIFSFFIFSPEMLAHISQNNYFFFTFDAIFATIGSAFLIFLSLGYQAIVYQLFKTRIRRNLLWAVLFLLPAILLSTNLFYSSLPKVRASKILSYGRLSALPKSAHEVKVYSWSSPFSGEWFLRFSATPEDIEVFLNSSPSIQGKTYKIFSRESMRLIYPDDKEKDREYENAGHKLFLPDPSAPNWYREEIRGRGRRYEIPEEGFHNWGEVIVDYENNVVYIKVVWS